MPEFVDGGLARQNIPPATANFSGTTAVPVVPLRRTSLIFDLPAYGAFNMPKDWQPREVISQPWGRLQVIAGGGDRTFFRGVPCIIGSWENAEPFDDAACSITFPQISWFDRIQYANSLSWLNQTGDVTIRLVRPDGTTKDLFDGFIASVRYSGQTGGVEVQCLGALFQADFAVYPPEINPQERDIGVAIPDILDNVVSRNYGRCNRPVTGILTSKRGSWGGRLTEGVTDLLSTAYTDTGEQWTVMLDVGRKPIMRLKDKHTRHWTVAMGAPGVQIDLTNDLTTNPNVVYGEGTDADGHNWRNTVYPQDGGLTPAYYKPLAIKHELDPYLYRADGAIVGNNPDFDWAALRIERYFNYGEGTSLGFARKDAGQVISPALRRDPNWVGSITLDADPEEGSRWEMRAGQNIWLKYFMPPISAWAGLNVSDADDGILLHISRCSVTPGGTVTCDVSYLGHDFLTLAALRNRNRQSTDRSQAPSTGKRVGKQTIDTKHPWDDQAGAGVVQAFQIGPRVWSVSRIPMGEHAFIKTSILTTSPATKFAAAVFSKPITAGDLNTLVPDPLSLNGGKNPWRGKAAELHSHSLQIAWGGPGQAAGYYPGLESEGAAVTGQLRDEATWHYETKDPPWMYLAVWAPVACTVQGQFRQAPEK
jgi:hypothetical protein